MSYDFLGLVNDICRRLNEVELTTATFNTATGFYAQAKDAINSSIRHINQTEFEWPFNHVEEQETLRVGASRYSFPDDAKTINFNSFRIKENVTLGNNTTKLSVLPYEEYLDKFVKQEYNSSVNTGVPNYVVHAPSLEFIVTPQPDKAYTLVYEYSRIPVDLNISTDVPYIPERFRYIIVDGAMYYAYMFRGNTQDASLSLQKFEAGIKNMRTMLINRYYYVRSGMIVANQGGSNSIGPSTREAQTTGAVFDG